jgi:hypothetical protein
MQHVAIDGSRVSPTKNWQHPYPGERLIELPTADQQSCMSLSLRALEAYFTRMNVVHNSACNVGQRLERSRLCQVLPADGPRGHYNDDIGISHNELVHPARRRTCRSAVSAIPTNYVVCFMRLCLHDGFRKLGAGHPLLTIGPSASGHSHVKSRPQNGVVARGLRAHVRRTAGGIDGLPRMRGASRCQRPGVRRVLRLHPLSTESRLDSHISLGRWADDGARDDVDGQANKQCANQNDHNAEADAPSRMWCNRPVL